MVSGVKREHANWLKRLMTKASKWVGADVFKSLKLHTHLRRGGPEEEIPKLISEVQADLGHYGDSCTHRDFRPGDGQHRRKNPGQDHLLCAGGKTT